MKSSKTPPEARLTSKLRKIFELNTGITEKRMFGGNAFLLDGNMVCGTLNTGELVLRLGRRKVPALYMSHT